MVNNENTDHLYLLHLQTSETDKRIKNFKYFIGENNESRFL